MAASQSSGAGPVIVEFAGLPGSGKTTVTNAVRARLEALGYRCGGRFAIGGDASSRVRRAARVAAALLRRPRQAAAAVRLALAVRPRRASRLVYALHLPGWPVRWRAAMDAGAYDVVLLDEGVVQNGWSTLVDGDGDAEAVLPLMSRLLREAPPRLVLVHFDLPVELSAARSGSRADAVRRFDAMGRAEAIRLLTRHQAQLERLWAWTAEAAGAAHLRVDARRPIDETVRDVTDLVVSLVPRPRG